MISFKTVLIILFFILFAHALATIGSWYWIVPWVDMPMHFAGGLWVALLFFYLNEKYLKINGKTAVSLTTVSFGALIGVLWEFFEYIYSFLFPSSAMFILNMPINLYKDTLSDLFFDIVGAMFFCALYLIVDKIKKASRIEV